MVFRNILRHVCVSLLAVFLLLAVPFLTSAYGKAWLAGDADAVTSATVPLSQPSGDYVILINRDFHKNAENLQKWISYLSGETPDILVFEDVSCSVASADTGAVSMAESFQSRLPENQMKVDATVSAMLLSRADAGKFDILIMSEEFAEQYGAQSAYKDNIEVIRITGNADSSGGGT